MLWKIQKFHLVLDVLLRWNLFMGEYKTHNHINTQLIAYPISCIIMFNESDR